MSDNTAFRAVVDLSTDAAALAAIAERHPELRAAVRAHPNCYAGLRDWIDAVGIAVVVRVADGAVTGVGAAAEPGTGAADVIEVPGDGTAEDAAPTPAQRASMPVGWAMPPETQPRRVV